MSRYFFSTVSTKENLLAREIKSFDKAPVLESFFGKVEDVYPVFSIYRTQDGKFFPATDELTDKAVSPKNNDSVLVANDEADFIGHVYAGDISSYNADGVKLSQAEKVVELYKQGNLVLKSTQQNKNLQGTKGFRLTL